MNLVPISASPSSKPIQPRNIINQQWQLWTITFILKNELNIEAPLVEQQKLIFKCIL